MILRFQFHTNEVLDFSLLDFPLTGSDLVAFYVHMVYTDAHEFEILVFDMLVLGYLLLCFD